MVAPGCRRGYRTEVNLESKLSKQAQTKDVFDRLEERDDAAEQDAEQPAAQADADAGQTAALAARKARRWRRVSWRRRRAQPALEPKLDDETDEIEREPDNDEKTEGDPDDDEETAEDRQRGTGRRRVVGVLVGVVVVAAVGLSALLGWRLIQVDDTAAASRAALDAAKKYAAVLTTLNAKDIDTNYQQALEGATGEFKDEYSQGSTHLRQLLIDNQAEGKGVVVDAAVKSVTTTKVDVLLFVDQTVSNAALPEPRIDRNRVQMTMVLVGHRWLASKVDII